MDPEEDGLTGNADLMNGTGDENEYPDYDSDQGMITSFLKEHTSLAPIPQESNSNPEIMLSEEPTRPGYYRKETYIPQLNLIYRREYESPPVIKIYLEHLSEWDNFRGDELCHRIELNTLRYRDIFCTVVDTLLKEMEESDDNPHRFRARVRDPLDILTEQRINQSANTNNENNLPGAQIGQNLLGDNPENQAEEAFPAELLRRYELYILPRGRIAGSTNPPVPLALRKIRSPSIGSLVTLSGLLVRSSDVKPLCIVATYTCDKCGSEIYQRLSGKREFMPERRCPVPDCASTQSDETLFLQTRGSRFIKFQELKIQELPNQVPPGHVPRGLTVVTRGELTRVARPGEIITIDGVFLPLREESGFNALRGGLVAGTYLEAMHVLCHKSTFLSDTQEDHMQQAIFEIASGEDPVGRLSRSLAPEIYGHEDVKRALLLQLTGGVERNLSDGMRIRGDINVCLMGDPGVAKSQLLKHVSAISPRGVYTTGKGSSGVGLTAAVTKDATTGEMALEGGALILADKGLCCIDEFDKMDESDRTAIHEVMEQQTVSIAKAGIVATLNARASVLAAANPLYGRYNKRKSLSENINLPNSLLSRFDLLFLLLDPPDMDKDLALARHVTLVHQTNNTNPRDTKKKEDASKDGQDDDTDTTPIPPNTLKAYISKAKEHQPTIPANVAPYIIEAYVGLRTQESNSNTSHSDQTVMTPRQLLSILRLSQGLARLRFSDYVAREDVDESIRLTHMSKASLLDDNDFVNSGGVQNINKDAMSKIFNILTDYATVSRQRKLELKVCEAMVLRKGFTIEQLNTCLEEYQELDVLQLNATRTHVHLLD